MFRRLFSKRKIDYHLTARERDILRLTARGYKNKDIAQELGIAEQTVKNHLTSVFLKLGVRNRTEAALKFQKLAK